MNTDADQKTYVEEWDASYSNGDNNILYPQAEVVRFLNRFIRKRSRDGKYIDLMELKTGRGLDFACGIGTHALTFADFNIYGYGVDISNIAIDIAKTRAREAGLDASNFIVLNGETQKIPFEDNYFDFVVAESCLDSMPFEFALKYIKELERICSGLIFASFIGNNSSITSKEFTVTTEHEKGTFQVIYDENKIGDLLGLSLDEFIDIRKVELSNLALNETMDTRYYCVWSAARDD